MGATYILHSAIFHCLCGEPQIAFFFSLDKFATHISSLGNIKRQTIPIAFIQFAEATKKRCSANVAGSNLKVC